MFNREVKRVRAQSTLEYTVIISVIVAALLSMQVYIKRGIQGKLRSAAEQIGQQYDPTNTTSDMTTSIESDVTTTVETVTEGSGTDNEVLKTTTTVTIDSQKEKVSGREAVGELGSSL